MSTAWNNDAGAIVDALECGGLTPLWCASSFQTNLLSLRGRSKAVSSHRTPYWPQDLGSQSGSWAALVRADWNQRQQPATDALECGGSTPLWSASSFTTSPLALRGRSKAVSSHRTPYWPRDLVAHSGTGTVSVQTDWNQRQRLGTDALECGGLTPLWCAPSFQTNLLSLRGRSKAVSSHRTPYWLRDFAAHPEK